MQSTVLGAFGGVLGAFWGTGWPGHLPRISADGPRMAAGWQPLFGGAACVGTARRLRIRSKNPYRLPHGSLCLGNFGKTFLF